MKLLVPLDQSPRDRIAINRCTEMAKEQGATVVFTHVVALPKSLIPSTVREAEAYLAGVEAALREEHIEAEHVVRRGDPATEIIELADKLEVDMIVMATRGRRGWDKLILGSVAEAVLAASHQPVMLVNELTSREQLDELVRLQSYYLAGVVWNKQAKGDWPEDEAVSTLERLARGGLDRSVLFATYRALAHEGIVTDWLDLKFQIETLRQFMPSEVENIDLGHAA